MRVIITVESYSKLYCINPEQADINWSCNRLDQMTSTGPFQLKITSILQHLPNACLVDQLMREGEARRI